MVQELLDQDSRLLSTFHLQERLIGVVGRVVCFLLLQIAMELVKGRAVEMASPAR
jgi:hypothetical protein